LVHTEDGGAVHSVMVGGKMVVENRRPVGVDLPSLARRAETARERLAAVNAGNRALFERLAGLVNAFCPRLAKTPYHIDRLAAGGCSHGAGQEGTLPVHSRAGSRGAGRSEPRIPLQRLSTAAALGSHPGTRLGWPANRVPVVGYTVGLQRATTSRAALVVGQ